MRIQLLTVLAFALGESLVPIRPLWSSTSVYSAVEAAHILTGSEIAEKLGFSVAGIGDTNADGFDDFVIGAPDYESRGRAFVISGKTGQVLHEIHSLNPRHTGRFGQSVAAAGDINADGFSDWAIGDPGDDLYGENAGRVFVFSGYDASLLRVFHCDRMSGEACGAAIAGNCNYDGNAAPDFLISASGGGAGGKVYVYSSSSPEALRSFETPNANDQFGYSISCSGDFDGDNRDDIAIGAPGYDQNSGAAYVFSGVNGELLLQRIGNKGDRLGHSLSLVGDIDQDGADDLLIGAPQISAEGYAVLISSQTGTDFFNFQAVINGGQDFGAALTYLGDVNQDGIPDLLIGDPKHSSGKGQVYIFSGQDQSILYRFDGESLSDSETDFGHSLYASGDANADGTPDIIIGAPLNSAAQVQSGRAYVFYVKSKTPNETEQPPLSGGDSAEEPLEDDPEPEPMECPEFPNLENLEDFIKIFDQIQENFSDSEFQKFQHYIFWLRIQRAFKNWWHGKKLGHSNSKNHKHHPHHHKEKHKNKKNLVDKKSLDLDKDKKEKEKSKKDNDNKDNNNKKNEDKKNTDKKDKNKKNNDKQDKSKPKPHHKP